MNALRTIRQRTQDWNQPMLWLAAAMAVMTPVVLGGLLLDDRMLTGAPIWAKPLKFAVSIAIYAVTWAWLASLATRFKRVVAWSSAIVAALLAVELVVVVTQVLRGTTSHFNYTTPLNTTLFVLMGVSIAGVWVGTLALTGVLMFTPIGDAATRWAIRLGAVVGLAGISLGALMTSPTHAQLTAMRAGVDVQIVGAHTVGIPDGGPGLPILGWSTTGGDLRIPHFVGMHALQLLPLFALALGLLAARLPALRPARVRAGLIFVAAGGYAGIVGLVTWQALRGQSLIHPDRWTLLALGALITAVGVASVIAVIAGRKGSGESEYTGSGYSTPDRDTPRDEAVEAPDAEVLR